MLDDNVTYVAIPGRGDDDQSWTIEYDPDVRDFGVHLLTHRMLEGFRLIELLARLITEDRDFAIEFRCWKQMASRTDA